MGRRTFVTSGMSGADHVVRAIEDVLSSGTDRPESIALPRRGREDVSA
jgi:hypothetical protein